MNNEFKSGRQVFSGFRFACVIQFACLFAGLVALPASAQYPTAQLGEAVPRDVREIYEKGLKYLAASQADDGSWPEGSHSGPGVTGMAVMTFLASGEDPNFGIYSGNIRRGLRNIVKTQDAEMGIFGGTLGHTSMYNHGFAMLALAEAYGAVDESALWSRSDPNRSGDEADSGRTGGQSLNQSLGQSLELAVRGAVTSQKKNKFGGWRYGPDAKDADTSVSGAVMVGLLAARNAGIEVPDEAIDRGVAYFKSMTSPLGHVAYSGLGGFDNSVTRISIGSLVYSVARRKDMPEFKSTLASLTTRLEQPPGHSLRYGQYYQAQALFQGDVEAWGKWNRQLIRELKEAQQEDGSFSGQLGQARRNIVVTVGHGSQFPISTDLRAMSMPSEIRPVMHIRNRPEIASRYREGKAPAEPWCAVPQERHPPGWANSIPGRFLSAAPRSRYREGEAPAEPWCAAPQEHHPPGWAESIPRRFLRHWLLRLLLCLVLATPINAEEGAPAFGKRRLDYRIATRHS